KLIGFGLATSGPVIAGVVIAVEAGASAAGGSAVSPAGGAGGGTCADAIGAVPTCQAAASRQAAPSRRPWDKLRVIGQFPVSCGSVAVRRRCPVCALNLRLMFLLHFSAIKKRFDVSLHVLRQGL